MDGVSFFSGGVLCFCPARLVSQTKQQATTQVEFKVGRAGADGHSYMAFLTQKERKRQTGTGNIEWAV